MPSLHVRNLDDAVIAALKRRAAAANRSLEGELRQILQEAAAHAQGGRRPRRLHLHEVELGGASRVSRSEIYGDAER
jgi:plasmid stability protein